MGQRVKIQLTGANTDEQHVRFSDFLVQFTAIKNAFSNVERIISGNTRPSVYFRVVDLSHSSPAALTLEAHDAGIVQDLSTSVVGKFFSGLQSIRDDEDLPPEYDRSTLEAFKGIGATLRKHVTQIHLSNGQVSIDYNHDMVRRIDRLLGSEGVQAGSMSGRLDAINVHNNANKFYLYPALGPKKIVCHFPASMVADAISAIQKRIEVSGTFKYRQRDRFPYEIEVDSLRVFSLECPTLASLRGISPNATGDLDSVAFVREIRNAVG